MSHKTSVCPYNFDINKSLYDDQMKRSGLLKRGQCACICMCVGGTGVKVILFFLEKKAQRHQCFSDSE